MALLFCVVCMPWKLVATGVGRAWERVATTAAALPAPWMLGCRCCASLGEESAAEIPVPLRRRGLRAATMCCMHMPRCRRGSLQLATGHGERARRRSWAGTACAVQTLLAGMGMLALAITRHAQVQTQNHTVSAVLGHVCLVQPPRMGQLLFWASAGACGCLLTVNGCMHQQQPIHPGR